MHQPDPAGEKKPFPHKRVAMWGAVVAAYGIVQGWPPRSIVGLIAIALTGAIVGAIAGAYFMGHIEWRWPRKRNKP